MVIIDVQTRAAHVSLGGRRKTGEEIRRWLNGRRVTVPSPSSPPPPPITPYFHSWHITDTHAYLSEPHTQRQAARSYKHSALHKDKLDFLHKFKHPTHLLCCILLVLGHLFSLIPYIAEEEESLPVDITIMDDLTPVTLRSNTEQKQFIVKSTLVQQ